MEIVKRLFAPYSKLDSLSYKKKQDYIQKLLKSDSVSDNVLGEYIIATGRLPGELWTPMHTVVLILYLLGFIGLVITVVLEAI